MLKRRNTIHPLQQYLPLVTEQEPYTSNPSPVRVSSITTNPFLSSSCDDDLPPTIRTPLSPHTWHPEVYSEDYTAKASYGSNKSPIHPFLDINPFLPLETTINDDNETTCLFINNNNSLGQGEKQLKQQHRKIHTSFTKLHRRLSSSQNHSLLQQLRQQRLLENDDPPEHDHSRRLSLDLFKAPFNWSRRRRATCAASDLRRVLTFRPQVVVMDSAEPGHSHISEVENFPSSCKDPSSDHGTHISYDNNEILKSSKYHPDEDPQDEVEGEDEASNQAGPHARHRLWQQRIMDRGVQSLDVRSDMGPTWRERDPQRLQGDGFMEATDMTLPRRRHSVFSDSFMEERPRKQEVQQQGHVEEQILEDDQHPTPSLSSMVRSRTDTVLDQHHDQDLLQHRRHSFANYHHPLLQSEQLSLPPSSSSALPPPPPPVICRRRNTVVAGGSWTQQQASPIFSSFENRDVPKDEFPFPTEKAALVSRDAPCDYEDKNQDQQQQQQPWTPTDSTRDPYDRRLWPLVSRPVIARRESQSYAHDFMKESERWRPNPWVPNTCSYGHAYSNSCLSLRNPRPQLRIFPHEKRPFYSERNGFHTQPYGYEESDEHEDDNNDDDDDDDEDADEVKDIGKDGNHLKDEHEKGSGAMTEGAHVSRDMDHTPYRFSTLQERHNGPADFEDHENQANTDRYYYEAMRWQEGVAKACREEQQLQQRQQQQQQQAIMNDYDYLEPSPLLSTSPPPASRTSQGRLIRRASVAKAKFYQLLHHNRQQQSHSPRQGTGDVDTPDQDVLYARDDVFEVQEDEEKEEEVHGKSPYHGHHDDHHDDNGFSDGFIHIGGGEGRGGMNSSSSAYSFTSSFRARVRFTRTKTVLRQVKHRLSAAARSMI
ncbi:unnamed protein product [Mortierella alpina]